MTRMNWDRVNRENRIERANRDGFEAGPSTWANDPDYVERASDQQPEDWRGRRVVRSQSTTGATRKQLGKASSSASSSSAQPRVRRARTRDVSKSARKRRAAQLEADRRGITVEQLRTERRAKGEAERRLHERAVALGITVKELRRRGGPAD